AGPHDRFHRSGVEKSVLDEALVDVNANDLAEGDEARGGLAVDIVEPDGPQPFAFQGTWRGLDTRGFDQQRRSGFQACRFHLVHARREGPRRLLYRFAQVPNCKVADEFAGLLDKGDRVLSTVAGEHHHWRIARNAVEKRVRGEIDLALQTHRRD